MEYKGYDIELSEFGYVVCYCGDEIVFATETECVEFIDNLGE